MKERPQTANDLVARIQRATPKEFTTLERSLRADTRLTVQKALDVACRRIQAQEAENARTEALYDFDRSFGARVVLGLDEVGRGPIAGPLAVGGVILPAQGTITGLNDSKKLSARQREDLSIQIRDCALAWTVVYIEADEIDASGMAAALRKAFTCAIEQIEAQGFIPDVILLDGNPLRIDPREHNVIKGDMQSASIAAASILAKVDRDRRMVAAAQKYPGYAFEKNKGYASAEHTQAISRLGLCPLHRRSFCHSFLQETLF